MIEFIDTLFIQLVTISNYSATANLHILVLTVSHISVLSLY
jgi:hypothetical protein